MKTNIQNPSPAHQMQFSLNRLVIYTLLVLAAPLIAMAQQAVFYDTFGSSTINGGAATNMQPGGIPTASFTSYEIASGKNATSTTNVAGHFRLTTATTSSGNTEAQALFTKYPVSLVTVGDYIELSYVFTDTTNIYNNLNGNACGLFCGLFNSGGVAPLAGTLLWNGGLGSSTTAATGGTVNWLGYNAGMLFGQTTLSVWNIATRQVQTQGNNTAQQLLFGATGGTVRNSSTPPGPAPFPVLTIGSQYTVQFRITLSATGAITVSNAMYAGTSIGGTTVFSNITTYTGAQFLTTNFDGLAVGYRCGGPTPWTNDISSITVVAGLAAQAGPYFFVNSSGDPCSGGVTVSLSGSVTTNDYRLFRDNVDTGTTMSGTGSALSFGIQVIPGTYTVVASNTVTASVGPMYGNASIFAPGVTINTPPVSVNVVSNLPASFSVAANGAALSYQWYKDGVPLANNANISGAQTTNLLIAAVGTADVGGYTVVAQTPCGQMATSAPPASLIMTQPRNLIWAGGNPANAWNYTDPNFLLSASPATFAVGDDATFDDNSSYQSVTMSNNLTASFIFVNGTKSYTFGGPNKLTGISQLVDSSSGILTIVNANDYTGGTIINNGATLSLGDGTSINGSVKGIVTVSPGAALNYSTAASSASTTINIQNALGGNGIVNFNDANGATFATALNLLSSNFNGTINIQGYTRLHASDNNAGYAFGNGSTVNVPDGTQAWLDRSATAYNNTFNIAGNGWLGATPQTGAMSMFGNVVNGPINLLANARIGGTINGGTIQSVISGAYQLEVWGTTNSYVLTMGPTNGSPQAYASTLITAGSISAANSNAISSGSLTLDVGGDMRVNGNNVTVASLTSINSGNILQIEGARVRNMHATVPGTLTVGTDGSSSQFDGTFSDGAAASFGLTKVGAGTLTLTAVNTNTGPVTVNGGILALSGTGSFSKAAVLAVATGATLSASGRNDATLTLNVGQTLKHSGVSTGPINVAGNVNLGSGTLLFAVNHSSLAHDSLTASGSVTYSGTLTVTNTGAALQAGDSFQLFASGAPGFTSFNLQTNDVINNMKYAWNNTVVSDGKITVASASTLVNTNSPQVQVSVSGGVLSLAWPTNAGWTLLTNSAGLTATNQWFPYPNSATVTNVNINMDPKKTNVFFRMAYPYP